MKVQFRGLIKMPDFDPGNHEYLETHPWITFEFTLEHLTQANWMRIGEVISKCDHIAGVPLAPAVAKDLHAVYLAKGVHATTSIEGNTLSEEEVRQLVDGRLDLPQSQGYLAAENENIIGACNMIMNDLFDGTHMLVTHERIKLFHSIILKNLPPEEGVIPGEIRTDSAVVGNVYRGAPARDCEYLLARLCDWLQRMQEVPEHLRRPMAILRAILAHLYIAWIHPFGNGNGRTARLVEYQLLAEAGLPTPACHLLSNHYNRTRTRYYEVLRETSRHQPYPVERFVVYALDGLVDGLREQLSTIRAQQMTVAWINYVHECFRGKGSITQSRQRELVLSLSSEEFTQVSTIRQLTPSLAVQYADKQQKTVSRDLNALEGLGLIERSSGGVRALAEQMAAFLPFRRAD